MGRAAIRYAKAILQETMANNTAETVFDDMQVVQNTIQASKELRSVLKSPVIKGEDKMQALSKIFDNQSKQTTGLIKVLVANKRVDILGEVAQNFITLYNDTKGAKAVQVITAVPISSEIESQVISKVKELTGTSNITIENTIDESIIGGFILRVGDLQYNASIANKLSSIKREFSKTI